IDRLTQTETRPARRVPPSGGATPEVKAPDQGGVETRIGAGVIRRRRSGGEEVRIETKPPVLERARAPIEPAAPEAELPKAKSKRGKKSAEPEAAEAPPEAAPTPQETAPVAEESASAAQEKKKSRAKAKPEAE